jgi:uncharacterized cupredoxin-like copper-binding protein
MSTSSRTVEAYYEERELFEEALEADSYSDQPDLIQRTPWWIISVIFHAAFLIMAAMWVVSSASTSEEFTIFEMNIRKFKRPEYNPTIKRDIKRNHKELKHEVIVETPVITKEDLPIDELETPDDMEREHKARGRQEAISTIELQGDGWVGVFGVGGGGSGAYGWRDGGGKKRALGKFGGGAATESAVLAALRWFKRHQAKDGSWSFEDYHKECKMNPGCEHIELHKHNSSEFDNITNCATGFALLCFLGAGHTHKAGRFRQQVADGLAFLEAHQTDDGAFSKGSYGHAITTMAIAEAYGMTKSAALKEKAQKAVDIILKRQNEYLGWGYYKQPSPRNDTSVTGWQVMALKSAKSAGLSIGQGFEGAQNHFKIVTPDIIGGDSEPKLSRHVGYMFMTPDKVVVQRKRNSTMTAIGCLARVFMGEDTEGIMLRAHGNKLLEHLPGQDKDGNFYMWYYATLAMFQMGGEYWKQWNVALKKVLLDSQRKGGCEDGSWDPMKKSYTCPKTGRIFSTATGCLSLEVYYRYLPISLLK